MAEPAAKKKRKPRRSWGSIETLPSGRMRATYTGPDLNRHTAGVTYTTLLDAEAWLIDERRLIERGNWTPPDSRLMEAPPVTLRAYADQWLTDRELKPRTRHDYRKLLDDAILPTLGDRPLEGITPLVVRAWWSGLDASTPTRRAHAYSLLRTVMNSALAEQLVPANPCHIRGAGNVRSSHRTEPATLDQLAAITDAMPDRYQLMVMLAAWCAFRFGELTELRRKDVDVVAGVIRVRRGVTWVTGGDPDRPEVSVPIVGTPKSHAGIRDVHIPPHLLPMVTHHLDVYAAPGRDGLLFPAAQGGHMRQSALFKVYGLARKKAGRPDLRWHDLRHTGAVLAASTGATLAELMARLGHSTAGAALRYQHAAQGRDAEIAGALSLLTGWTDPDEDDDD